MAWHRWKIEGIRDRRHHCSSVKVACGPRTRTSAVTALTSHVIPTASMAPITDDPINNSNLGVLTLHLSVVRLLVVARPRPSMLDELLDCQDHLDSKPSQTLLQEPTRSTKAHRYTQKYTYRPGRNTGQIWNIRCNQYFNKPTTSAAPTRLHHNDLLESKH